MTSTFTITPRIVLFVRMLNELIRSGAPDVQRAMISEFADITKAEFTAACELDMLIDAEIERRVEAVSPNPPGGVWH